MKEFPTNEYLAQFHERVSWVVNYLRTKFGPEEWVALINTKKSVLEVTFKNYNANIKQISGPKQDFMRNIVLNVSLKP